MTVDILAKARVLQQKRLLITDPRVKEMNETQWVFELESLLSAETREAEKTKAVIEGVKNLMIKLLGLDIMPIEDSDGKLRERTVNEPIPLMMAICRPEVAAEIAKRVEGLQVQHEVEQELKAEESGEKRPMTLEEAKAFMGDIEFLDDPNEMRRQAAIHAPDYKNLVDNIKPMDMNAMMKDLGITGTEKKTTGFDVEIEVTDKK